MRLYVGNVPPGATEEELRQEFMAFGKVESVSIGESEYHGQQRPFAYVVMSSDSEGRAAVNSFLGGRTFKGCVLDVAPQFE